MAWSNKSADQMFSDIFCPQLSLVPFVALNGLFRSHRFGANSLQCIGKRGLMLLEASQMVISVANPKFTIHYIIACILTNCASWHLLPRNHGNKFTLSFEEPIRPFPLPSFPHKSSKNETILSPQVFSLLVKIWMQYEESERNVEDSRWQTADVGHAMIAFSSLELFDITKKQQQQQSRKFLLHNCSCSLDANKRQSFCRQKN